MDELFTAKPGVQTRWASFENPDGLLGKGALTNHGAKGDAFHILKAGETVTMMHAEGSGVIRRIWITISRRDPVSLRKIVIRMTWDNAEKPAVECPLGDFFGFGLAKMVPFDSELFASPEGRSFVCTVPMPFLTAAKVEFINNTEDGLLFFYDVDYTLEKLDPATTLYFHAFWNRENPVALGKEYTVLPEVMGSGRYLGTVMGWLVDTETYSTTWIGEGEMKFYMGGEEHPTLVGTGTEDYVSSAWGMGTFVGRLTGCLEGQLGGSRFEFYRWHTVDPIYFRDSLRVTIHDMGNDYIDLVRKIQDSGAPMIIVNEGVEPLYDPEHPFVITDDTPKGHLCFYRQDDFASVAYFYLDSPASNLPALAAEEVRTARME